MGTRPRTGDWTSDRALLRTSSMESIRNGKYPQWIVSLACSGPYEINTWSILKAFFLMEKPKLVWQWMDMDYCHLLSSQLWLASDQCVIPVTAKNGEWQAFGLSHILMLRSDWWDGLRVTTRDGLHTLSARRCLYTVMGDTMAGGTVIKYEHVW